MSEAQHTIAAGTLDLAVLISGGGRTLENLVERINAGSLDARIRLVISSNPAAFGLQRAARLGLPAVTVARKAHADRDSFSAAVWQHVRHAGASFTALAGFLSLLTIPDDFAHRVVNIHPALLPAFGGPGMFGHHVHQAVLDAGCKVTGCTVHFCDQTYDTGPILVQQACDVREDDDADTLAARVFEAECDAYPRALSLIAAGRVTITGHRTRID